MICEVCSKPAPEDPIEEGWARELDGGDEDACWMWFCPECMNKWDDPQIEGDQHEVNR